MATTISATASAASVAALLVGFAGFDRVDATSMKMDFLPFADARLDPIVTDKCLSDHVHTFYGAAVGSKLRPELSYDDMRSAGKANSGNVEENLSLYWHPTVYEVDVDGAGRPTAYTKAPIWFASSYYVWETGQATAFPNGFKMIARGESRFECVGPSECERGDANCAGAVPGSNFPATACWELEVSTVFPSCWDGVNLDSSDHMSHVAYTDDGLADSPCPASHPVHLPQIHWYWRIKEYKGGRYEFSDGSSANHADYFSGWDTAELQKVLDECSNDSMAAMPDKWCQNHLTFRDGPKKTGDVDIVANLAPLQPAPALNPRETVAPEKIDGVATLPRGTCTGVLLPANGEGPSPPAPTPPAPTPPSGCINDYDLGIVEKPWPDFVACDEHDAAACAANPDTLQRHCRRTCGTCEATIKTTTTPAACPTDDRRWRAKGKKRNRGCTWVAQKARKRCSKKGTDGRRASAACPATCGAGCGGGRLLRGRRI